jgi:hypothetical protein
MAVALVQARDFKRLRGLSGLMLPKKLFPGLSALASLRRRGPASGDGALRLGARTLILLGEWLLAQISRSGEDLVYIRSGRCLRPRNDSRQRRVSIPDDGDARRDWEDSSWHVIGSVDAFSDEHDRGTCAYGIDWMQSLPISIREEASGVVKVEFIHA